MSAAATLPALSTHRWLRFATFTAFYLVQGFPIGLLSIALPAWFIQQGMAAAQVASFVAITGLPWAFKLIAGPFMDRYSFPPMGLRRPWVMGAQLGLFLASSSLLFVADPLQTFWLMTAVGFAINSFAATQDVAVDGMAIDVLQEDERGRANAFMAAGQVVGYSLSGAIMAITLDAGGMPLAGAVLTVMVGIVAGAATLLREREGERLLPWSDGQASPRPLTSLPSREWRTIITNLLRVLLLPMSLLLIVVEFIFRGIAGTNLVLFPVVAVDTLGYSALAYASWTSGTSLAAALAGLLIGPLIDRFGVERIMLIGLLLNAVWLAGFGQLQHLWHLPAFAAGALIGVNLIGQVLFVSVIALFMSICSVRVAATQFAVYMAIANLARSTGAGFYPTLAEQLDSSAVFIALGAASAIAALLLSRFRRAHHLAQVARAEA